MVTSQDIEGALGIDATIPGLHLRLLDDARLAELAPGIVHVLGTYSRHTLAPTPGGLFDEALFGLGATLDPIATRVAHGERAWTFARIRLAEPFPHPIFPPVRMTEVPVLPPDLRPLALQDDGFVMADVNSHYLEVLRWNGRLERLLELPAVPAPPIDGARVRVATALARLMDNERQDEPLRAPSGRLVSSLRGLLRPDARTALTELATSQWSEPQSSGESADRVRRFRCALLAMGVDVVSAH